jgi:hypothetical protein
MMHVSWTTLREQIFAKLRRPYRSEADMNEVGHALTECIYYLLNTCRRSLGTALSIIVMVL